MLEKGLLYLGAVVIHVPWGDKAGCVSPAFSDTCSPTLARGQAHKRRCYLTPKHVGYALSVDKVYGLELGSAPTLGQNTPLRATGRGDPTWSWAGVGVHVPQGDDRLPLSLHLALLWRVPPGALSPPLTGFLCFNGMLSRLLVS